MFFNCEYNEETMGDMKAKVWPDKEEKPSILDANVQSNYFYMILSGPIYIMDKNCMFWYGSLEDGSYFGDISVFFDEPS